MLKRMALRTLTTPIATRFLEGLMRDVPTILMLHRMADGDRGITGYDAETLRRNLESLRRQRFHFLSLSSLSGALANGGSLPARSVIVTIDDGYMDQGDIACPILIEFDCPATVFVTSGFLDGDLWFWWDRIDYILRNSQHRRISVEVPSGTLELDLADPHSLDASRASLERVCKAVSNDVRIDLIERLAELAEVDVPAKAPVSYAPMSWDDVRRLERSGIGFGPHTATHPILSRTTDTQSRREIMTSWERLCAEAAHPVDVFCYPNGQADDFSDREVATIRELGLSGAVTGMDGYITRDSYGRADQRYHLPRFPFPADRATLTQYVNGLEFAKTRIRRAR